jgi:hypothetical protein
MLQRTGLLTAMLAGFALSLITTGTVHAAPASQPPIDGAPQAVPGTLSGKVTDVIEAAAYTYAEVDTGSGKVWAATTTTSVKTGDTITFSTAMPMNNFHSNALKRDFPVVYFAARFDSGTAAPPASTTAMPSPHGKIKAEAVAQPVAGIDKVEGGNTIAELYSDRQALAGKTVRVRGKVTKYTAGVMGKNWVHIRDSSSPDDLTVTTSGTAALDNIIVVEGKLGLDRDFGYGYVYPVIVEDATVTKE